jgi:hypothetical protein
MVRLFVLTIACCLLDAVGAWGQSVIPPGEFARVAAGGATLVRNDRPAIPLDQGTWFEAARASGSWTAGFAYVMGARHAGWVLTAQLAPESPERRRAAEVAWAKAGAQLDRDAQGAVLAIDASGSQVGDTQMAELAAFPRLEEISLGGSQVTKAGLPHLVGLPCLRRVFLDGLALADDDLQPIARLTGLEGLSFANTKVTDPGLEALSRLTDLQVLNLSGCAITDEGLRFLEPLVRMETLALKNTKIRGPGLEHFHAMENLNVLNLSHTPLEGQHLLHLGGLDNLRILHIADCRVEPTYIEQLEDAATSLAVFD